MKEIDLSDIELYAKALHCPIRWDIIETLKSGPKSSKEIFHLLKKRDVSQNFNNNHCRGKCIDNTYPDLKKHSLYYHLRELEGVNIITLDEYKPSDEGRAPEKVWKLNLDKLIINFR